MEDRQKINSITLRENYPDYYRDIFSSCQVVVSASDTFFWAGEFARFFGGLTIMQKLPTKNLVGLEVLDQEEICFADKLLGYTPAKKQFHHVPFDSAKEKRLLSFLKKYWPTINTGKEIKGFKIHILSESHCGGGLGTTGVYLACLSTCMHLLAGKIINEDLENWAITSTNDLLNKDEYQNFRDVFRFAWRLTAISRGGHSAGATAFMSMLHTPYPIFYFSKNMSNYINSTSMVLDSNLEDCGIVEKIPFWGSKMEEIFPMEVPQPWPIDVGRVFSGTTINTETIYHMLSKMITDIDQLQRKIDIELAPKTKVGKLDINSLFDFNQERNEYCSYLDFVDVYNILAVQLSFTLKDLFIGPISVEESLRNFFSIIHKIQDYNHFLSHSNPHLDEVCKKISEFTANENEFNFGSAKVESIGKGGHILFTGPTGAMPEDMPEKVEKFACESKKNIYLDWASWIDGFGESGITVEQNISAGKYSEFITKNAVRVTKYFNGNIEIKIVAEEEALKLIKDSDLTLDARNHKILIAGESLHSKEIFSAKATVDILHKILASPCNKIFNKEFANSSYGQSRYDLQSKIFIPLDKALQNHLGKKLDFHISGGMYDDFSVCANLQKLKISLIENVE